MPFAQQINIAGFYIEFADSAIYTDPEITVSVFKKGSYGVIIRLPFVIVEVYRLFIIQIMSDLPVFYAEYTILKSRQPNSVCFVSI